MRPLNLTPHARTSSQLRPPRAIMLFVFALLAILCHASSATAATFVVTKTADTNDGACDSDCSLREALSIANSTSGSDTINFSSLFSSIRTIVLTGGQLEVSDAAGVNIAGPGSNLLLVSGNNA